MRRMFHGPCADPCDEDAQDNHADKYCPGFLAHALLTFSRFSVKVIASNGSTGRRSRHPIGVSDKPSYHVEEEA